MCRGVHPRRAPRRQALFLPIPALSRNFGPHAPAPSAPSSPPARRLCTASAAGGATTPGATATRRLAVFYTPDHARHAPPPGVAHPENPGRLDACVAALRARPALWAQLDWADAAPVEGARRAAVLDAVNAVHSTEYLDALAAVAGRGGGGLDGDTYVAPASFEAALRAAAAWLDAVDAARADRPAWALARPPGHHAGPGSGMGFCLLSNAAIAARHALAAGAERVAVLDFDVHHGNGTEAAVLTEPRIRFASSHQTPLFPGTGAAGVGGADGNVLNVALAAGTGMAGYRARYEDEMLPFLLDAKPDVVIVSAGFDALDVDPLAGLDFKPGDYRTLAELLMRAVPAGTPVVFGLEGGYDLGERGVGAGVAECMAGVCRV